MTTSTAGAQLTISNSRAWLLATRPKTLTAALVPVLVGTAVAYAAGATMKWHLSALALLSSFFIQIGTNLVNDAIDFKKGADTEKRIGPVRVTQSGLLSPSEVMTGAYLCFAAAVLSAIPLVLAGGWTIVAIGLLSLFFAYGYTGGPFPLAYLGLGDLFVFIFFGLVAVGGVYFLQTGSVDTRALVAGAQTGLLATVLIAINNLRDREGDIRAHKRTLAVRLGIPGARAEIAFLCAAPFLLSAFWAVEGLRGAAFLPFLSIPLAIKVARQVACTPPGPEYNRFLGQSASLHLLFGILFTIGCLL